jgi:hypothetical protein
MKRVSRHCRSLRKFDGGKIAFEGKFVAMDFGVWKKFERGADVAGPPCPDLGGLAFKLM